MVAICVGPATHVVAAPVARHDHGSTDRLVPRGVDRGQFAGAWRPAFGPVDLIVCVVGHVVAVAADRPATGIDHVVPGVFLHDDGADLKDCRRPRRGELGGEDDPDVGPEVDCLNGARLWAARSVDADRGRRDPRTAPGRARNRCLGDGSDGRSRHPEHGCEHKNGCQSASHELRLDARRAGRQVDEGVMPGQPYAPSRVSRAHVRSIWETRPLLWALEKGQNPGHRNRPEEAEEVSR